MINPNNTLEIIKRTLVSPVAVKDNLIKIVEIIKPVFLIN